MSIRELVHARLAYDARDVLDRWDGSINDAHAFGGHVRYNYEKAWEKIHAELDVRITVMSDRARENRTPGVSIVLSHYLGLSEKIGEAIHALRQSEAVFSMIDELERTEAQMMYLISTHTLAGHGLTPVHDGPIVDFVLDFETSANGEVASE